MPKKNKPKRAKRGQARHDRTVLRSAKWYKNKGYKVKADIPGYSRPKKIKRYIPDLIVKKGKKEIVIEVETKGTVKKDKDQHRAFKDYAKLRRARQFRKKVV